MTGVSKARPVAEYVKMLLSAGEKVLLAGWHRDVYDVWLEELAPWNIVLYTGTESPKQKEDSKQAFIHGDSQCMAISLRSGAGMNGLQDVCDLVVFGEWDWSPLVHHQLTGRLRRDREDGKKNRVTAIHLASNYGSDPLMIDLHGLKSSQSSGIIDPLATAKTVNSDEGRIKQLAKRYLEGK